MTRPIVVATAWGFVMCACQAVTGQTNLLVNSYLGGDRSTGTLTSPPFMIERRHFNFLIGAGNFHEALGAYQCRSHRPIRCAASSNDPSVARRQRRTTCHETRIDRR